MDNTLKFPWADCLLVLFVLDMFLLMCFVNVKLLCHCFLTKKTIDVLFSGAREVFKEFYFY